jgi:hypothetical protein
MCSEISSSWSRYNRCFFEVFVDSARDLLGKEDNGLANPYVQVEYMGATWTSSIKVGIGWDDL